MQISSIQASSPLSGGIPSSAPVAGAGTAAPTSADGFAPAVPPDVDADAAARLGKLVFNSGKPTQLDRFLGDEAQRIEKLEKMPVSEHAPQGGWAITFTPPASQRGNRTERFLRNHEDVGYGTGSDELGTPPFGRWTRAQDGWKAECILDNPDASAKVRSSMMRTLLHDDGKAESVLWELHQDGGGIMFRLDGDALLQEPTKEPRILEVYAYAPGQEPQPSFPFPLDPLPEIPTVDQFIGDYVAPRADFTRLPVDSQMRPLGGWKVDLSNVRPMAQVSVTLRDHFADGEKMPVTFMEKALFGSWTKTPEGWVAETESSRVPETFGQVRGSRMRTMLRHDGQVTMSMRVDHNDGSCTVHKLDANAYRKDQSAAPVVLETRTYPPYQEPEGDNPTAGPGGATPPPPSVTAPTADHTVRDEGDWIIVGGVRVPKKQ